jgi:glycosyltransferase involved in cell wall biosynthesis
MKIVCIAASFVPSNAANSIQVVKAAHALAVLGHDVTLLVPGDSGAAWEDIKRQYGLSRVFKVCWIRENLAFRRYDFALKAVRAASRMAPDLIYTWVLQGAALSLWRGLPTILELHDRTAGTIGPWLLKMFWKSKTLHRLLTNTAALKQALIEENDLDVTRTETLVAPNGVELERYQDLPSPAEARAALDLPEGFTVGYTGHFYAGRGIELMAGLAKALPEVHFLWVGGKPDDVAFWKDRLQSSGIQNVTLTGFVDNIDLPQYQAAADVLLMPYGTSIAGSGGGNSVEIASPMKMFEYMAAGRAIISSDLPVIHEVLKERMAVFCPPDDIGAWKNALLALKDDADRRQRMGAASRKAVVQYTWRSRAERALAGFIQEEVKIG